MFDTIFLHRPLPYGAPGNVMLSDLSPTTNYNEESEVYETIEADHEYEILDKYNQAAYDSVKISPPAKPQCSAAATNGINWRLWVHPAYVPMTTTSIHGNTKPAETPSTAAHDDQKM